MSAVAETFENIRDCRDVPDEELRAYRDALKTKISMIITELKSSYMRFRASGVGTDPTWYHRANRALTHSQRNLDEAKRRIAALDIARQEFHRENSRIADKRFHSLVFKELGKDRYKELLALSKLDPEISQ